MSVEIRDNINKFFVLGISYKKTSIEIREKFSIPQERIEVLLGEAKRRGVNGAVVISTCNRTEIYGHSSNIEILIDLFKAHTVGNDLEFNQYSYLIKSTDAIEHIFRVTSGLDSQIIGDFQVVGQVKEAYKMSEHMEMVNTFLNRIFSYAFKASKRIKNETDISKGASSVSHAAVQYIKEQVDNIEETRFLLFGTGQIGKDTCSNLLKHMVNRSLTLVNRTSMKAENLADKYQISHRPVEELKSAINESDVIVVATGASKPTITADLLEGVTERKLFLDLSVPRNVSTSIESLPNVDIITVDGLSQYIHNNMLIRRESLPLAEKIIREGISEFYGWLEVKVLSPVIVALKENLDQIRVKEIEYHASKLSEEELSKINHITTNIVNKISSACINHIKDHHKRASSPIETLNMIFKMDE